MFQNNAQLTRLDRGLPVVGALFSQIANLSIPDPVVSPS